MKIAVVGGGSTYTPELIDGFARLHRPVRGGADRPLAGAADRRRPVCQALATAAPVSWTSDLDAGLDGAGIVVIQLRVGGQQARISDETFPLECGCIGQETTGAGGLAKALRTVPVVLDVATRAAQRAPGAWIVNFTNPVGHRHPGAAGRRASGRRAVQRGDRLPAPLRRAARRGARGGHARPRRAQPPHLGTRRLCRRRRPAARAAGTRPREQVHLPLEVLQRAGQRALLLPALLLRTRRGAASSSATPAPGARRWPRSRPNCCAIYHDPALTTKPELLAQRGGAFYSEAAVGLITSLLERRQRDPRGQPAQRRSPAVPARRGRHRGQLPGGPRRRRPRCRPRPVGPPLFGSHRGGERLRGARPRGRPARAAASASTSPCWRTRSWGSTTSPSGSPIACSPRTSRFLPWARK